MHIISRKKLKEFYEQPDYKDAEGSLTSWFHEVKRANLETPADVKALYGSADILRHNRVVFNIGGNKYRLVVKINYPTKTVFIRFVGTHREYDRIDAEVI